MAKTVVVEKGGIRKTVQEEYKKDYIVAGWKEVGVPHINEINPSKEPYNYNPKI